VQRRPGARFVDAVAVSFGHVAEADVPKQTDVTNEISAAQSDLVHGALVHRELPEFD